MERTRKGAEAYFWLIAEWAVRLAIAACCLGFFIAGATAFLFRTPALVFLAAFVSYHLLGFLREPGRTSARWMLVAGTTVVVSYLIKSAWPYTVTVGQIAVWLVFPWCFLSIFYGVLQLPRADQWTDEAKSRKDCAIWPVPQASHSPFIGLVARIKRLGIGAS